jgi:hypothetical protein
VWHWSTFHRATCGVKFPSEVRCSTPKIVASPQSRTPTTIVRQQQCLRESASSSFTRSSIPPPFSLILPLSKIQVFSSQLSASIFNTTFNPSNVRTGNKVLRQRLKGAALAEYYPPRVVTIRDMRRLWPKMKIPDEDEETRVTSVERYVFFFG